MHCSVCTTQYFSWLGHNVIPSNKPKCLIFWLYGFYTECNASFLLLFQLAEKFLQLSTLACCFGPSKIFGVHSPCGPANAQMQSQSRWWHNFLEQESPAVADKPARRESLPKIAPFNVLTTLSLTILVYLHSFSCCCIRICAKSREMHGKFKLIEFKVIDLGISRKCICTSRSSYIIYLGVNRKPICDFLLVINCNFSRICYRFRDIDV